MPQSILCEVTWINVDSFHARSAENAFVAEDFVRENLRRVLKMPRLFFPLRTVLSRTISSTDQVALQLWEIFNRVLPVPQTNIYLLPLFVYPVVSLGCVLLTVFRNRGPFLESPETLRAIFGCHNSLCISITEIF